MRNSNTARRSAPASRPASWPGHLEITSKSLLSILERSTNGAGDISIAERSLFMACEFWAAIKTRTLAQHLGANASGTLPIMGMIFSTLGATGVARDIDAARTDLATMAGDRHRQRCVNDLQNRLLLTEEPVDTLLARFAIELFGNSNARLRRNATAAKS